MAAICIQNPHTFNHAIETINRDLLKAACQEHRTLDDRDQFVQAVFQSFLANGGADIIKQLVAIKQNPGHDAWKDEECKRTLEQDWFLFINQILNFGRPTPAVNGVFTDVDQVNDDDGESIEFTQSFDYFLYQDIMKCRGLPTMPTHHQGRGNAIKIRHDLANLIIQNFVQTTFADQINSLKDLVNLKDHLEQENLELKRSMAAEMDPAPKRPKVAPQVAPQAAPQAAPNVDSGEVEQAFEEAMAEAEAAQESPKPTEVAQAPEEAQEEAAEEQEVAKPTEEAVLQNPWVEICEQHNTVMSNINPKQWEKKNKAKVMKEFLKKLVKENGGQPDMGMSLVRAIRDSSGNVDSNIWDEPLFSDINDEEPDAKTFDEIMVDFCNIIKNNWGKIQEALAK